MRSPLISPCASVISTGDSVGGWRGSDSVTSTRSLLILLIRAGYSPPQPSKTTKFLPGPEPQDTNQVPVRGFVQRRLARTIQLLTVIYPAEPHPFNSPLLVVVPMAVDCRRASQAVQAVADLHTGETSGCRYGNQPENRFAG